MQFLENHTPPKGTPKYIEPSAYDLLSREAQYYYKPEWAKHITKKVREYEVCDLGHKHYMGWVEKDFPVGKPYRYIWTGQMVPYGVVAETIDAIMKSNVLASRILKKEKQ